MGASLSSAPSHKKGRFSRRRSHTPMTEINVTPFVDVMLVLLIVFMVAAPLLSSGVSVDLPSSEAKPVNVQDDQPIDVSMDRDGTLFIGETQIQSENLIPLLRAMTEGQSDRRIYIRGDRVLSYGDIMRVIGAINAAGFNKVALITNPEN